MKQLQLVVAVFILVSTIKALIDPDSVDMVKDVLLRKPYEQVCDPDAPEEPPPPHVDQTRPECPLPLNSSSRLTGCLCQFDSNRIECVYSDRLAKLPLFAAHSTQIEWSIDLKCKNISHLDGFEFITNLTSLSVLDLSGLTNEEYFKRCKFAAADFGSNETRQIRYINKIGLENKTVSKSKQRVKLGSVNFESNEIRSVHMIGEPVHIKHLNLARNQIENLSIRANLDICTLKLNALNISLNRIRQIEIGFLIFLNVLNVSHNQLSTFSVDFYDTREFFAYARNVCFLNYTTLGGDSQTNAIVEYMLSSNLVEVDFSHNVLGNLPFAYLKNVAFLKLEKLVVIGNRLKALGEYELSGLPSLRYLSLRSNLIENVDEKSFLNLNNLKFLDISVNFLQTIPDNLFESQQSSLETLLMSHNYLETIPRRAFRHLASLKHLNLNCNRIRAIQNYSFGYMSSLVEVSMAANSIESIEPEAFSIDQSSLLGPGLIEKLDLSGNKIATLNQTVFFYLTNLRHLILSNNKIRYIDRKVFRGISFLITLDISFNQLNSLDFLANRNFSLVRYLTLSNNRIRRLRPTQFVFLKSLTHLDLSANRISRIDDCAFSGLESSIRRVYLNYNRIRRLNSCAFAVDFRQLRFVQIQANPLNCSHNCEFFYVIYNPPYSINYEGFECANLTQTNFTHCSAEDFDLVYKKCRAKMRGDRNCSKLVSDVKSAPVDEFGMLEKNSGTSAEDTSAEDYSLSENLKASEHLLYEDEDEDAHVTTSSCSILGFNPPHLLLYMVVSYKYIWNWC